MRSSYSDKKEDRKINVLANIIYEYITNGIPISSKLIAERIGGEVCSATIRNIMAELEAEGLILQPHTSAGRVPTYTGYRRYVDTVCSRIMVEKNEAQRLSREYNNRINTLKDVIEVTTALISRELKGAGVAILPGVESLFLKHLELVKLKAETVLAVMVSLNSAVKNYIVMLDEDIEQKDLEKVSNYINSKYETLPFLSIVKELRDVFKNRDNENNEIVAIARTALSVIDSIVKESIDNELYWQGINYFLDDPDFAEKGLASRLIRVFSEGNDIISLLREELPEAGIKVYIGDENKSEELQNCAVITAGYIVNGNIAGRIGIVGNTRMDYARAFGTLSCLSDLMNAKLRELSGI